MIRRPPPPRRSSIIPPRSLRDVVPPPRRPGEPPRRRTQQDDFNRGPDSINLEYIERTTRGMDETELRWFFLLRVLGNCDSDSVSKYIGADSREYSTCWHAATQYPDTLIRWCKEARAECGRLGVSTLSNESAVILCRYRHRVTRADVVTVLDYYVKAVER